MGQAKLPLGQTPQERGRIKVMPHMDRGLESSEHSFPRGSLQSGELPGTCQSWRGQQNQVGRALTQNFCFRRRASICAPVKSLGLG